MVCGSILPATTMSRYCQRAWGVFTTTSRCREYCKRSDSASKRRLYGAANGSSQVNLRLSPGGLQAVQSCGNSHEYRKMMITKNGVDVRLVTK